MKKSITPLKHFIYWSTDLDLFIYGMTYRRAMPWRLFSRGLTPSGLTLAIFSQVFFFFEAFLRSLVFSFSNFTLSAADEYFNLHNIPENTELESHHD